MPRKVAKSTCISAPTSCGELARVQIALQVGGDLKLVDDKGKTQRAAHERGGQFGIRRSTPGTSTPAGKPTRSVRYYDDVRAVIKIDKGGEKPAVDPTRRLIVAERKPGEGGCQLYSPAEPLKREELDLIDVPGNRAWCSTTCCRTSRWPAAKAGKSPTATLAALLCLDAVSWCDASGILGEIKDGVADIAVGGTLNGAAVAGISTEIELKIKIKFDMTARRDHASSPCWSKRSGRSAMSVQGSTPWPR